VFLMLIQEMALVCRKSKQADTRATLKKLSKKMNSAEMNCESSIKHLEITESQSSFLVYNTTELYNVSKQCLHFFMSVTVISRNLKTGNFDKVNNHSIGAV